MKNILELIKNNQGSPVVEPPEILIEERIEVEPENTTSAEDASSGEATSALGREDRSPQEIKAAEDQDDDLYSIKNFSI